MAANTFGVGFTIRATDLASGVLRRVSGGFTKMGASAKLAGAAIAGAVGLMAVGIASLSTGVAGLKGMFAAALAAGEFGQQIEFLGVVTGRTGARLEELRQSARDAALSTQFSPTEAIRGLRKLATAGLSGREAMESLAPALRIAQIGEISVAAASQAVVGAMKAFSTEGLNATQVADKLATAMVKTNFQGADFEAGLAAAAGTQGIFNQTLDDTLIGLGLLRNRGIGASRAATGLREATSRLASNEKARNMVAAMGIKIFDEAAGVQRPTLDLMFEMADAMKGMSKSQQNFNIGQILGKRGTKLYAAVVHAQIEVMRDGIPVILKGRDAVADLRNEMDIAAGRAAKLEAALLDTFGGQFKLVVGILQGLVTEIGTGGGDFLKPLVQVFRESIESIVKLLGVLPAEFKVVGAGIAFAISLALVFGGALSIMASIFVLLLPFMGAAILFIAGMGAAFSVATSLGMGLVGVLAVFASNFTARFGSAVNFVEVLGVKAGLLTKTLKQLFSIGGIKLPLLADLRDGHQDVLDLAVRIFILTGRLKDMGTAAMEVFQTFARSEFATGFMDRLGISTGILGTVFDLLTGKMDGTLDNTQTWIDLGKELGDEFVKLTKKAMTMVEWVFDFGRGIGDILSPIITLFTGVLEALGWMLGTTKGGARLLGQAFAVMAIIVMAAMATIGLVATWLGLKFLFTAAGMAAVGSTFIAYGATILTVIQMLAIAAGAALSPFIFWVVGILLVIDVLTTLYRMFAGGESLKEALGNTLTGQAVSFIGNFIYGDDKQPVGAGTTVTAPEPVLHVGSATTDIADLSTDQILQFSQIAKDQRLDVQAQTSLIQQLLGHAEELVSRDTGNEGNR